MAKDQPRIELTVDGNLIEVDEAQSTLLDVLRHQLGIQSVKDGCSPQGQCGCCTVLVDGDPRVACVTPVRRIGGRSVTTVDGLDSERRDCWADAFCASGASQCGFCTPGIIVRLDALDTKIGPEREPSAESDAVDQALLAHLCRCTGWQTIHEAWELFRADSPVAGFDGRDEAASARRAALEGGVGQRTGPDVALGRGGFAADTAPSDALVAVSDGLDGWHVGENLAEARALAGKVQGRRTTAKHAWPLEVPEGDWTATLRTTWVEPAFLETDASWCEPGGTPYSLVANGGAFGAKASSPVTEAARQLADHHDRAVLAVASREDSVRWGPKRPPVAGGVDADGRGVLRVVSTPGLAEIVNSYAPGLVVEEIDVPGPTTSSAIRAAGWAEAAVLLAGARGEADAVRAPNGAVAGATIDDDGIRVSVRCGEVLDETVLRSYCIGAAHMAWSWLRSEALTLEADGDIADLTDRKSVV